MTAPDETQSGVIRVIRRAIQDAGISPEKIGYINAHGTSTPLGDRGETLAVKKTFGPHAYKLAVSSTKSMTGHLLGAAGGIEAVFTVLAIHRRKLPRGVRPRQMRIIAGCLTVEAFMTCSFFGTTDRAIGSTEVLRPGPVAISLFAAVAFSIPLQA